MKKNKLVQLLLLAVLCPVQSSIAMKIPSGEFKELAAEIDAITDLSQIESMHKKICKSNESKTHLFQLFFKLSQKENSLRLNEILYLVTSEPDGIKEDDLTNAFAFLNRIKPKLINQDGVELAETLLMQIRSIAKEKGIKLFEL